MLGRIVSNERNLMNIQRQSGIDYFHEMLPVGVSSAGGKFHESSFGVS